jgi:hypothetical protein
MAPIVQTSHDWSGPERGTHQRQGWFVLFPAGKSKLFKENCSLKFDRRNGRDIVSFNPAAAALDNLSNIVKQSDFNGNAVLFDESDIDRTVAKGLVVMHDHAP